MITLLVALFISLSLTGIAMLLIIGFILIIDKITNGKMMNSIMETFMNDYKED